MLVAWAVFYCLKSVLGTGEKHRHVGQVHLVPHLLAEWCGANHLTSLRVSDFSSVKQPIVVSASYGFGKDSMS